MFHGSLVALVTPMLADGAVDYPALAELVEWHIASKTNGLVILGTTGESATIESVERKQIIQKVIKQVNNRLPVIIGTGSNSTAHTIEQTKQAMEMGADAALVVTPYYNKPTQEGLFQHFKAVAQAVPLPLILYNVPARTGCDLLPETVLRLAHLTNIVAIKEATGDVSRVDQLKETKLVLISGDDATAPAFLLAGGVGVISVIANVVPESVSLLCQAAANKNREDVEQWAQKLSDLSRILFCESNPIPTKWALSEMGLIQEGIRLPLTLLSECHHEPVRAALKQMGCLK